MGVLGCMAERLKEDLLRKGSGVDLVVGPDAYRDLPRLLRILQVILSGFRISEPERVLVLVSKQHACTWECSCESIGGRWEAELSAWVVTVDVEMPTGTCLACCAFCR